MGMNAECPQRLSQLQIFEYERTKQTDFEKMKGYKANKDGHLFAENYWMTEGYKNDTISNSFQVCADPGFDCSCNGTVYIGKKFNTK